jgi:hypothetical protein
VLLSLKYKKHIWISSLGLQTRMAEPGRVTTKGVPIGPPKKMTERLHSLQGHPPKFIARQVQIIGCINGGTKKMQKGGSSTWCASGIEHVHSPSHASHPTGIRSFDSSSCHVQRCRLPQAFFFVGSLRENAITDSSPGVHPIETDPF